MTTAILSLLVIYPCRPLSIYGIMHAQEKLQQVATPHSYIFIRLPFTLLDYQHVAEDLFFYSSRLVYVNIQRFVKGYEFGRLQALVC